MFRLDALMFDVEWGDPLAIAVLTVLDCARGDGGRPRSSRRSRRPSSRPRHYGSVVGDGPRARGRKLLPALPDARPSCRRHLGIDAERVGAPRVHRHRVRRRDARRPRSPTSPRSAHSPSVFGTIAASERAGGSRRDEGRSSIARDERAADDPRPDDAVLHVLLPVPHHPHHRDGDGRTSTTTRFPVGVIGRRGRADTRARHAIERSPVIKSTRVDDVDELREGVRRGVYRAGDRRSRTTTRRAPLSGRDGRTSASWPTSLGPRPSYGRSDLRASREQGRLLQAARLRDGARADRELRREPRRGAEGRPRSFRRSACGQRPSAKGRRRTDHHVAASTTQAPSNLILFVFITSLAGFGDDHPARAAAGSRSRMYGTPTSRRTIIAGETLAPLRASRCSRRSTSSSSASLVFGVDSGNPLGAVALIALFVLVGTAFGDARGTIFRTPEQAGSIGPPVGIAMGMLARLHVAAVHHARADAADRPALPPRVGDGRVHRADRAATARSPTSSPELAVLAAFVVVLLPLAAWRLAEVDRGLAAQVA